MNRSVPESVRLKEKRDAILKAQQVAEALTKENVSSFALFLFQQNKEMTRNEYAKRAEQYGKEYEQVEFQDF